MTLAFMLHRGRMSCSQAAGSVASQTVHRGELTRFLARPRWQQQNFNAPLWQALLALETKRGKFLFLIDATLVSQAGQKTQNTYSTGNRGRRKAKGRRYNNKKIVYKRCHSFTFGLLITPSGMRLPLQMPHYTQEYCAEHKLEHRTTAEAAADNDSHAAAASQRESRRFAHDSLQRFTAVRAWVEIAITTVLFLEYLRAQRLADRRLSKAQRQWWKSQRLHG